MKLIPDLKCPAEKYLIFLNQIFLIFFAGLQKQMLFMRCAFESRQESLTLYPFPGLKVINIRGSNLLALDLIVIGKFITCLNDNNRLLELSLRDYPLDKTGLKGLMPCLPLVRTITLCARLLKDPYCYYQIAESCGNPKSRLRELWLLEVPPAYCGYKDGDPQDTPDELGAAFNHLRDVCKQNNVRVNV